MYSRGLLAVENDFKICDSFSDRIPFEVRRFKEKLLYISLTDNTFIHVKIIVVCKFSKLYKTI